MVTIAKMLKIWYNVYNQKYRFSFWQNFKEKIVMNNFKRILALLLAVVFIGATLVACKKDKTEDNTATDGGNNNSDNGAVEDNTGNNNDSTGGSDNGNDSGNGDDSGNSAPKGTNEYGDIMFDSFVPKENLDFEGTKLGVLIRENKNCYREWHKESPEDELDEAVEMRNAAVGDTLNIEMDYQMVADVGYDDFVANFNQMMLDDVLNDMHYIDIGANWAYGAAYNEVRDIASNLNDKDMFPYFNFSLPCWNQAIVNKTTINDRLHYVAGDMNLSMFDAAMVIWYNKTLYDAKREDTDPENIQTHALAGAWTYNDLYTWAARLYEDSGTEAGSKDPTDTYGLCIHHQDRGNPNPHDAIPYAWDLEFVITNQDNTHSFNIIGNEKAEAALTKYRDLIFANGSCINLSTSCENFAAGNYVFWTALIYPNEDDNMTIREMEDTYGLLPWPKYDTDQENYGTTAQDYYTLMTVLDHSESSIETKGEAVSAYLQLATEESYTSVRGYYFNRIVKPKYFGTDDSEGTVTNSIALFDIIIANIEFEFWTIYSRQLNNVAWLWRDGVGKDGSLESIYKADQASYENAIIDTDNWLFNQGAYAPQ